MLAYHTGLRKSNLLNLTWADMDLTAGTASVARTKNGEPMIAALSQRGRCAEETPGQVPGGVHFAGRNGRPLQFRALWVKVVTEAGFAHVFGKPDTSILECKKSARLKGKEAKVLRKLATYRCWGR